MDALQLLSGDAQTFVEKIWASRVHVEHGRPDDFAGLLDLDDVDRLLTSTAIRTPAIRLARDGHVLPSADFTRSATLAGVALTGLVDARKVLDLLDDGATVVLQGLHRYWPPLTWLVRDLELSLGHPCQANAYLTPPGSRGFALHSDTHDVFVFQTHGRKQWEVHDDEGTHEIMLEPGTSMYLPAGTPHAARTHDQTSLHVTVGVNQITWRQVLARITDSALTETLTDAVVPAGYLDHPELFASELAGHLHTLATALALVDPSDAAAIEVTRFLTSRGSALRGALRDRLSAAEIDDETALRRRPGTVCVLREDDDRLSILLGDRELRVPLRLADPVGYVRAQTVLRPRDLSAWLDPTSRLVLLRRLTREGLLEVEG